MDEHVDPAVVAAAAAAEAAALAEARAEAEQAEAEQVEAAAAAAALRARKVRTVRASKQSGRNASDEWLEKGELERINEQVRTAKAASADKRDADARAARARAAEAKIKADAERTAKIQKSKALMAEEEAIAAMASSVKAAEAAAAEAAAAAAAGDGEPNALRLDGRSLGAIEGRALATVLRGVQKSANETLTCLSLSQNRLMDEGAIAVATAVRECAPLAAHLQTLLLEHNLIGSAAGDALRELAEETACLTKLGLAGNGQMGIEAARAIATVASSRREQSDGREALFLTTHITTLLHSVGGDGSQCGGNTRRNGLAGVGLLPSDGILLATDLISSFGSSGGGLTTLDLSGNCLCGIRPTTLAPTQAARRFVGDSSISSLARWGGQHKVELFSPPQASRESRTVDSAGLNDASSVGRTSSPAAVLSTPHKLRPLLHTGAAAFSPSTAEGVIDAERSNYTADAIGALTAAVCTVATLTSLSLGGNAMGDDGVVALSAAFTSSVARGGTQPGLRLLSLPANDIGVRGAVGLATAIGALPALTQVPTAALLPYRPRTLSCLYV